MAGGPKWDRWALLQFGRVFLFHTKPQQTSTIKKRDMTDR